MNPLLTFTNEGIYCKVADVYIDPWRPVEKAIITHGHSDHARWGSKFYLSTPESAPILRHRLGSGINLRTLPFGNRLNINGVSLSFHPAAHLLGSAQVRLSYKGEVWVVTGDYKTENDGISGEFEPVKCHKLITECTFGMPIFNWPDQFQVYNEINNWWKKASSEGKNVMILAYSLGKAQRILHHLDPSIGDIFVHGSVSILNQIYRDTGIYLPETAIISADKTQKIKGAIVIAPPSVIQSNWIKQFEPLEIAMASGWMAIRGNKRRRGLEKGFVVSDHADWKGLLQTVNNCQPEKVYATHGYTAIFSRYLTELGIEAEEVQTLYGSEQDDPTFTPEV